MIIHRISTFLHFLGTIPYICGKPYHSSWVFSTEIQSTTTTTTAAATTTTTTTAAAATTTTTAAIKTTTTATVF
jgi:hypothetical protein